MIENNIVQSIIFGNLNDVDHYDLKSKDQCPVWVSAEGSQRDFGQSGTLLQKILVKMSP